MKKFLALVLALVMTMSLVTISAGAEDFTDADKVTYAEAVDVMTAIGVVSGYENGSFNPAGTLTRGAAAKIICNMILGPTTAEALSANDAPFSDVAVDHVFAGYIAYCANEGIISGYADGTFRPAGTLTGYAFMKMLLGALGYDAVNEGYVGTNWSIQVAKRALNIGLNKGLDGDFVGAKALTREEACLYAFNTLKADMVEYANDSKITVGDIVISNSSKAEVCDANEYDGRIDDDGDLQFAEQYFTKLALKKSQADAVGRPAHTWFANVTKDKIGTYTDTPVLTYTEAVKGTVLADDLDEAGIEVAGVTMYRNSKEAFDTLTKDEVKAVLKDKTEITGTGNGILVEVYASDDTLSCIVVVPTYLAQIGNITKDKVSTKSVDERTITMTYVDYTGKDVTVKADPDTAGFDAVYEAVEKGDVVLVKPQGDNSKSTYALAVAIPETVEGVIEYSDDESIEMDDVAYGFAKVLTDAPEASEKEVVVYLDEYGYVIGSTAKNGGDNKAVAVLDYFMSMNEDGELVVKAKVVFADGTTDSVEVADVVDAPFCTYEKKKGVYTLTPVKAAQKEVTKDNAGATFAVEGIDELSAKAKKISLVAGDTTYFASDVNFIFVSYNAEANGDEFEWNGKFSVKEGVQKLAALEKGTYEMAATIDADGKVDTVFVVGKAANTVITSDALLYVAEETGTVVKKNADDEYVTYYAYDAYIDGEIVKGFYSDSEGAVGFYTIEVDSDTGAYVLDGNEYDDTDEDLKVAYDVIIDAEDDINNGSYVTAADIDLENATFVDNTENEIESLADLKAFINELSAGEEICVDVLYDDETVEALFVYVYYVG